MTTDNDELSHKEAVGLRLRQARLHKGLTLQNVADFFSSTKGYVANVEAGVTGVSMPKLIQLCKFLDADPGWVAGFKDYSEAPFVEQAADFSTDDFVLKSSFLEKKGLKSDHILSVEVFGKSMEPTLKEGSFAIANMEATGIIERDLFVLKVQNKYCVRWVEPTIEGNYKIESDQNDPFFMSNCTVTPMELTQLEIIGRVELVIG